MPKLPIFTANPGQGVIAGGRRATAEDMGAQDVTAGVHSIQRAAEGVIQAKEDDESRKVLVSQAEIRAKYAKRLDEAVTTGEDTDKIKEELNSDLAAVADGLTTKKGMETAALHAANTGAIFDNQANHIQVTRANLNARVAGAQFLNSTGAIVASNPDYLPQAEKDVDAFVQTLTKVSPEHRAVIAKDLKQNMNVAAAMSRARIDPAGVKKAVEGGSYDMTPEQRQQVIHQADATERQIRADAAFKRQELEYEKHQTDLAARDEHFKKIMTGGFSMRAVLDDPRLSPQSREHLALMQEARGKALAGQEKKSNPTVVRDLWLRVNAPDGTPGKIYTNDAIFQAVKAGDVNTTDANNLNNLLANQKDENNRSFSTRLNGRIRIVEGAMRSSPEYQNQPELASAIQLEMMTQVEKKAAALRKDGKSPDGLLDPASKDYFFQPNIIRTLARDVREQQKAQLPKITSPAEYAALNVGDQYVDSNGNVATKKAPRK